MSCKSWLLVVAITFLSTVCFLCRIFLIDTLNFCFWSDVGTEPFTVSYLGKKWTGSRSLSAALARAVKVTLE